MNIQEFSLKIKPQIQAKLQWLAGNETLFLAALLVVVAGASFALGRYSTGATAEALVHIEKPGVSNTLSEQPIATKDFETELSQEKSTSQTQTVSEGKYVGSKNSNRYHLPWCSGAKTISEQNKIWFQSKEEAESKGYIPAANCKGL